MSENVRDREHRHERALRGMQDRRSGDVAYGG